MPVRDSAPLGAPIWIDLATADVERAQEFYGAVFGWTFQPAGPEYGGYINAFCDGRPVAGLMYNEPQWNASDAWTVYFHVADIGATVSKATAAGGSCCVDPMEVKDKGWMSMLTDPTGGPFGLWQPTGHRGFEAIGQAGAPSYFQLTSSDYPGSLDFYRQVFGWQTAAVSDTDEFRYSTAAFDGDTLLGVMDGRGFIPAGQPSSWTVFLGAEDVDNTVRAVEDHGGSVIRAAEDTPYGRLAAVADSTGAGFNLSSVQRPV